MKDKIVKRRAAATAPAPLRKVILALAFGSFALAPAAQDRSAWLDERFTGPLGPDWSWIRPDPAQRRLAAGGGLELRVAPGNMWGPANNARNLLLHSLPAFRSSNDTVEIQASFEHHPTEQYEQLDLVWFYSESNMVKIGEELVDGQLSVVMGREEGDHTRTIAIIPLESNRVELRLRARGRQIEGSFRIPGGAHWRRAGQCDLPPGAVAKASLQAYQGPAQQAHWGLIRRVVIRELPEPSR